MKARLSSHDIESLSADLDGQLSQKEKRRIAVRLAFNSHLQSTLNELRAIRTLLHQVSQRHAPRNFSLTPKMAGIQPPVPRAVPALGWASATIMFVFICTFATTLLPRLSIRASAPMAEFSQYAIDSIQGETSALPPSERNLAESTVTPEVLGALAPETTPSVQEPALEQLSAPASKQSKPIFNLIQIGFIALALVTGCAALFVRWLSIRAFRRNFSRRN